MIKINDKIYTQEYFPDGTLRLRCETGEKVVNILWRFENNEELLTLYFLTNHLRRVLHVEKIHLHMPYIPNARMDRVKKDDEVFTLKYFAEFINDLTFDSVHVEDPHSSVALALIDRVVVENVMPRIRDLAESLLTKEDDILFFPDEGSSKRYGDSMKKRHAFGMKKRDWRTGEIQGLDIQGEIPENGFNVLIIDDICSFGGTFYHAAKKLKEVGANKIWLYVTHCENSVLEGDLIKSGLIEKIYTTDSIFTKDNDFIEKMGRN